MFRPPYAFLCPDPRSTCVPVLSFRDLRAQRLARPDQGFAVHPNRFGALSSPLPKPIAVPPSGSRPMHGGADASLLCSIATARHVGPRRAANRSDSSHCSLPEQETSNPRANNTLIFNNLQTLIPVTPVYSHTYKIGGGYFPDVSTLLKLLARFGRTRPSARALRPSAFSTFNRRRVNSSSTIPAPHSVGPNFTMRDR